MILSGDVLRAVADGASTNREVARMTGKTRLEAQAAVADLVKAGFAFRPRTGLFRLTQRGWDWLGGTSWAR